MDVTVRKPTPEEQAQMQTMSTWACEPSTFDWSYDMQETCLLTEGEVTVTWDGGSVSFGAGDYVVFPQGMDCVWHVTKAVRKHYFFS